MKTFKTPTFFIKLFYNWIWRFNISNHSIYLTFDDGPTPEITDWVLDELKKREQFATFFCVGKNIQNNPDIFNRIIREGHQVGNHTKNHVNGWKTTNKKYLQEITDCQQIIQQSNTNTQLFRPPYGKINPFIANKLRDNNFKIIMWDVLSRDFDLELNGLECAHQVIKNLKKGSIIVFHDSQKALPRLQICLPIVLDYLKANQYHCKVIS